jgi:hypothetical protein
MNEIGIAKLARAESANPPAGGEIYEHQTDYEKAPSLQ